MWVRVTGQGNKIISLLADGEIILTISYRHIERSTDVAAKVGWHQ